MHVLKGGKARGFRESPAPSKMLQEKDNRILSSKIALALMAGAATMSFSAPAAFAATVGPDATASQSNNTYTVNSAVDYAYGGYDASAAGGAGLTNNKIVVDTGAALTGATAANFDKTAQGYSHADAGSYLEFGATGGYSEENDVTGSSVTVKDGTVKSNVVGGISYNGNVSGNSVTMDGGTIEKVSSEVDDGNGNKTTVETLNDLVGGASAKGSATGNTATLNDGTVGGTVIGGQGVTATGNRAVINGGTADQVIGGYAYTGLGDASDNTVEVNGGTVGDVYGGDAVGSAPTQTATTGSANNNTVTYNGGTVTGNIVGGHINTTTRASADGNMGNNNKVILNSTLQTEGYLYGALDKNAKVGTADVLKGNTLTVNSVGNKVGGIYNFETMNVNADNIKNGDTVITVDSDNDTDTDLTKTKINVDGTTDKDSGLDKGDSFTVVSKADGGTLKTGETDGTIQKGVSKEYDLDFNNDGKNLTATLGDAHLSDQTKVFPAAEIAQSELVNLGGDAIDEISSSFTSAGASAGDGTKGDKTPWVHVTQNRGHVEDFYGTGTIFNVGIANTKVKGDNVVTVAPFIEYGHGNYGYDASNVTANTKSDLFGVGGIYRTMNEVTGNYFTGAARIGHVKGDFTGHNMKGANGDVTFNADGTYFAGQLRAGKIHAEGDREFVDEYAGFYFSHTPGESATMSSGEHYDFDAINSARLRVGIRHNRDTGKGVQYVGAYIQHEFAGDATGTFDGLETPGTQLKGTTAVGEVGYRQDVDENHKIGHDVSIKGYGAIGGWSAQRYGVQLNATIMGKF